jgi:hypothetical protein
MAKLSRFIPLGTFIPNGIFMSTGINLGTCYEREVEKSE